MSCALLCIARLADTVLTIRGEGDHAAHLFDFELLSGETQSFSQNTHGRRCRRHQSGITRAAAAAPAPAASAATRIAAISRAGGRLAIGGLQQVHGVVAFSVVQFPPAGEIHARGRRQAQLVAGASA